MFLIYLYLCFPYQYMTDLTKDEFLITDMSCASCAQTIEENLENSSGVTNANVNFANETASVEYTSEFTGEDIVTIIENSGYSVGTDSDSNSINYKIESIKAWAFTTPVMVVMILEWFNSNPLSSFYTNLFYLVLTSIVIFYLK